MSKAKAWIGLSAVAGVLILVAGWFLLIQPKYAEAAELRGQTASTEQQIVMLQSRLADLERKKENLPAEQEALARISRQLPADPSLPPLIRALTAAAAKAGVALKSIAPSSPAPLPAAPGADAGLAAQISVISLSVDTEGDYFAMERFVAALERLDRGLLVQGFSLTAPSGGEGSGGKAQLRLALQGQVFVASSPAAAGTAGTAGSASTAQSTGTTAN
jgi:type IV pilus assembly protein PilO